MALSQFNKYPKLGSHEASHPIKKQLCSPNFFPVQRIPWTRFKKQMFAQLRMGLSFLVIISFAHNIQIQSLKWSNCAGEKTCKDYNS